MTETPEQADLAAVRAQIAECDAAIQALAGDLPAVELRLALNKPPEDGDEALLERHRQLTAKLESLRRAETGALRALETAEGERKAAAMETRRRGYDQHISAVKRHMKAAQAAMATMYDEYMKACTAARSAVGSLPPGPMAARGGPGRSILNVAFLQRLMTVELVRQQRLAGDEQAWILRSSAGVLEFIRAGKITPMAELVETDAKQLKDLFARDWARATATPPAPPKRRPIEPFQVAVNASSQPFAPKPAAEAQDAPEVLPRPDMPPTENKPTGVPRSPRPLDLSVNLSGTEFAPRQLDLEEAIAAAPELAE